MMIPPVDPPASIGEKKREAHHYPNYRRKKAHAKPDDVAYDRICLNCGVAFKAKSPFIRLCRLHTYTQR